MDRQTGMSIVRARKLDLNRICVLEQRIFGDKDRFSRSRLRYLLDSRNTAFFLGLKNGVPIAYGIALKNRLRNGDIKGRIYSLGVIRELRHQGIGTLLLDTLESWLVAERATFITLETKAKNGGASHFFRDKGYQVTEFLENYYAPKDGLRMKKLSRPLLEVHTTKQPVYPGRV